MHGVCLHKMSRRDTMAWDPRRDLLGRDRDILLRDQDKIETWILSKMRPRWDVSTSHLETEMSQPRPHPCLQLTKPTVNVQTLTTWVMYIVNLSVLAHVWHTAYASLASRYVACVSASACCFLSLFLGFFFFFFSNNAHILLPVMSCMAEVH